MSAPGGERRTAARSVAWTAIESAAGACVGLALTPLVLRSAGIEGLGLWAACWSLAHAAGTFDGGVGASYSRFTARAIARGDRRALDAALAAGAAVHLALWALIAVAGLALFPWAAARLRAPGSLAPQVAWILTITLATVGGRMIVSGYRGVVAGAQRIDLLGRIGAAAALLEGGAGAAVLLAGGDLRHLALTALAAAAVASLAEAVAAHRLCPGMRVRPFAAGRSELREVLSFGMRLQVVRAAEILAAHAPRLALAAGPGLGAAGAYDLGARVAALLRVAGALPLPIVQPMASRLDALGDRARLRRVLGDATRYVALLGAPPAALVLAAAPDLLVFWTGAVPPDGATQAARCLCLAGAVGLLVSPLRLLLRGVGQPGAEAAAMLVGSAVHVTLAAALAPAWGIPGVAAAALAASIVAASILGAAAARRAPDLAAGIAARVLRGPVLAATAGGLAAAAAGILPFLPVMADTRAGALLRLGAEGAALGTATVAVALVTRAVVREDFALLRDLVPVFGRSAP